jgi:hypothetical protein
MGRGHMGDEVTAVVVYATTRKESSSSSSSSSPSSSLRIAVATADTCVRLWGEASESFVHQLWAHSSSVRGFWVYTEVRLLLSYGSRDARSIIMIILTPALTRVRHDRGHRVTTAGRQ